MTGSKVLFSTLAVTALAFAAPATAKIVVVTDSNGVQHNLSDFAGQKVVLEWTNEGCPYVKKHYNTNNMQKTQQLATAEGASKAISLPMKPMHGKLHKGLTRRLSCSTLQAKWAEHSRRKQRRICTSLMRARPSFIRARLMITAPLIQRQLKARKIMFWPR